MVIHPTYKLAMAAAKDEANRHAKKNGRSSWNEDDWNVATETFDRIFSFSDEDREPGVAPCPFCGALGDAINFDGAAAFCCDCRTQFLFYPKCPEEAFVTGANARRDWSVRRKP